MRLFRGAALSLDDDEIVELRTACVGFQFRTVCGTTVLLLLLSRTVAPLKNVSPYARIRGLTLHSCPPFTDPAPPPPPPINDKPPRDAPRSCSGVNTFDLSHEGKDSDAIDLAYSADASMLAIATEDKHLRVSRTGGLVGAQTEDERDEERREVAGRYIGSREIPKKPTSVLFAPCRDGGTDGGGQGKTEVRGWV